MVVGGLRTSFSLAKLHQDISEGKRLWSSNARLHFIALLTDGAEVGERV